MANATETRHGRGGLLGLLGYRGLAAQEAAFGLGVTAVIYLFFACLTFVPIVLALYISTTKWDALTEISQAVPVGINNYVSLLQDQRFLTSLLTTFQWTIKTYLGQIGLGLLLAIVVTNLPRFQSAARVITFSPYILPIVATGILFQLLMNPVWGTLNTVIEAVGLPPTQWLSSTDTAMNSIVMVLIWKNAGYYMILFMTAILAVPQEYYDAAHIDGANPLQTFQRITWPLILPAFLFISVINVISNLQVFTPVYVMTGGGPGRATEVTVMLMYNTAFMDFRYSVANAMAVILFALILVLTVTQFRLLRQGSN
jgi:multiple sugar transport system permease protein